jgi:thiamine-monophosphate kinase
MLKIDQVPVHPLVKANFPDYLELALYGGEDYELLFTANKTVIKKVKQTLNCPVTVIGDIVEETISNRVTLVGDRGNIIPRKKGGWEHFKDESVNTEIT